MDKEEPPLDREARGRLCDAVFGAGVGGGCSDITCLGSSMERKRSKVSGCFFSLGLKQLNDDTMFY